MAEPPTRDTTPPLMGLLMGKTSRTLLVMVGLLAIPFTTERLSAFRVVPAPWARPSADVPGVAPMGALPSLTAGSQPLLAASNEATITNALPAQSSRAIARVDRELGERLDKSIGIEDPTGKAMNAFYRALARTELGESKTHILHYGDSIIASDYISGTARRLLQKRFGDAGHGFILIANPWRWYFHNDVTHHNSEGWEASRLSGPIAMDGIYGLGGVSFVSAGGGIAYFGTATKGDYGRRVSRFDVYYLEHPQGGEIEIRQKTGDAVRVPTKGPSKTSKTYSLSVPDGEAQISLRATGQTRLFGVSLERETIGVTYSALGAHAAMAQYWKQMDPAHWAEQMSLRSPSLIVWQYGTNESDLWRIDWPEYEANLRAVLTRLKAAAPSASILVMSALDRAENSPEGLRTKPVIHKLRQAQKTIASEVGVAFWDVFTAMGGDGTMAKWAKATPALCGGDLTHPTPAGADILGGLLVDALLKGYRAWGETGASDAGSGDN